MGYASEHSEGVHEGYGISCEGMHGDGEILELISHSALPRVYYEKGVVFSAEARGL